MVSRLKRLTRAAQLKEVLLREAQKRGVSYHTLARKWLTERLLAESEGAAS